MVTSTTLVSNYKPVSLLNTIGKVLEKMFMHIISTSTETTISFQHFGLVLSQVTTLELTLRSIHIQWFLQISERSKEV